MASGRKKGEGAQDNAEGGCLQLLLEGRKEGTERKGGKLLAATRQKGEAGRPERKRRSEETLAAAATASQSCLRKCSPFSPVSGVRTCTRVQPGLHTSGLGEGSRA